MQSFPNLKSQISNLKSPIIILVTLFAMLQFSCEKVIELNLNEAGEVLVIEGSITDTSSVQYVRISRSVPFTETNAFPPVSNATVTLTESDGKTYTLSERPLFPGVYRITNLRGEPLKTYHLKVTLDGNEFTASSFMSKPVKLDSLGISKTAFFNEEILSVNAFYNDPLETVNFYRFIVTVNGRPSDNIYAYSDDFNDGKTVSLDLQDPDDDNLKPGDEITVEMQGIDENVFRYFEGLDQNENRGGASTTPANPVSNLSNGALGYFSAHSSQTAGIIVR